MNGALAAALAQSLTLYAVLTLACLGWGQAGLAGLRPDGGRTEITASIWLGWAVTLLLLQLVHFWLPLTAASVLPVYGAGIALGLWFRIGGRPVHGNDGSPRRWLLRALATALFVAAACWLAARAMAPPAMHDSGLYYFSAIRWANQFPVIPGLGNLHGRLAFNQSFFDYVAALNFHPYFGHGRSIANSFLFLLALATAVAQLRPLLRRPHLLFAAHPFRFLPALLLLPLLAALAVRTRGLASPTPDLASTLLQMVMFLYLARWLVSPERSTSRPCRIGVLLLVLAATAITVKLSNAAFALAVILLVCLTTARARISWPQVIRCLMLPCALILGVFFLRGYLLSGTPLYPSTLGHVSFEWAVPMERVEDMYQVIQGWARRPGPEHGTALADTSWLEFWLATNFSRYADFTWPLALTAIFLLSLLGFRLRGVRGPDTAEWSLLVPLLGGVLFWAVTAPDLRFAHAVIKLLPVATGLLLLASLHRSGARKEMGAACLAVFLACNLGSFVLLYQFRSAVFELPAAGFAPVPTTALRVRVTHSGLAVHTPIEGDQVWDAPLPATPWFDPDLRLRKPGDLSSGFVLEKPE